MSERFEDYDVAVATGRLAVGRGRSIASITHRQASYALETRLLAAGHVLTIKTGFRRRLHVVLAPRTDPLLERLEAIDRVALEGTGDELLLEEDRYQLSFLARPFEPRVEREFEKMLASLADAARRLPGSLVFDGPSGPSVVQFSCRPTGVTIETHHPLPVPRIVLSTYTNIELR